MGCGPREGTSASRPGLRRGAAGRSSRPLGGVPRWGDGAERQPRAAATRVWDVCGTECCPVFAGMESSKLWLLGWAAVTFVGTESCAGGTAHPDESTLGLQLSLFYFLSIRSATLYHDSDL